MEIYADDLKYFEPDTENKTNVPESIDKVKNNEKDLKAQHIYQDSKLLTILQPQSLGLSNSDAKDSICNQVHTASF